MSVSNKIRALLNLKDMKPQDLSTCLGISVQAVRNKFTRDSFSVNDIIKISSFLNCELLFKINDSQNIELSLDDLKQSDNNVSTISFPAATQEPQKEEMPYKPFTEVDAARIDLLELLTNIMYQIEIRETFGKDVFEILMKKAKQQEEKSSSQQ